MPHRGRMLFAFAVVPFAAALISMGSYDLFWHAGFLPQGAPIHSVDAAQAMFAGVMVIAVPMTLIGTVPGVLWLNRKRWLTFSRLVALGAVLGNLPFVLIVIGIVFVQLLSGTPVRDIGRYWYGVSGFFVRTALGVVVGAGSAAAFWLVAVCGTTGESGRSSLPLSAP
jgi:hypothetical protein